MHDTEKIEILFEACKQLLAQMERKHEYHDKLLSNCGTTIQKLQKELHELKMEKLNG